MIATKKIKVGLVGAGNIASHYSNLIKNRKVLGGIIVGVADVNIEAASELASQHQCKSFVNVDDLIDSTKPDLVLILTPSGFHYEHALAAMRKGCHVLIEKPAAVLPSQGAELIALAKSSRLMLGVAFQNRFNDAVKLLKRTVDAGRFGKLVTISVRLRWCRTQEYYDQGWRGTWALDGGVVNQQAIHHLDALNWIFGPIDKVCAIGDQRLNKLEAEDTMVAIMRMQDGALATLEATTAARPEDYEASISVLGEHGMAEVGGPALNRVTAWHFIEEHPSDSKVIEEYSMDVPNGMGLSHIKLLQKTFDNLSIGQLEAPVSVESGNRTTELIHALYSSEEIGGWVSMAHKPESNRLGK